METRYRSSVAIPKYPPYSIPSRFPPSYPAYMIDGISRLTWSNDAYKLVLEKLLGEEHLPMVEFGKTSLFQVLYHPPLREVMGADTLIGGELMGGEWQANLQRKSIFMKPNLI